MLEEQLYNSVKENSTERFAELFYRRNIDTDLNHCGPSGETTLKLACGHGNSEIVTLLIKAGADVNITDSVGEGPLYAASSRNQVEIVKLLLECDVDIDSMNQEGASALYVSALRNHVEVLNALIEAGADVKLTDNNGSTALHVAAEHTRSAEAAEALLAAGADVRAVNKLGWSPLHEAAQNDNALAVGIFLQHGANVELTDVDGWTPLYVAAQGGHNQALKALVKLGHAHVDPVDRVGNTALMAASKRGHVVTAELLLLAGADYFLRNQKGRRARDLAVQPELRSLFRGFDLSLAAARLYCRHHAEREVAPAEDKPTDPAPQPVPMGVEEPVANPTGSPFQSNISPLRLSLDAPLWSPGSAVSPFSRHSSPTKLYKRSRQKRLVADLVTAAALPAHSPAELLVPCKAMQRDTTTSAYAPPSSSSNRHGSQQQADGPDAYTPAQSELERLVSIISLLEGRVDALQQALLEQDPQQKQPPPPPVPAAEQESPGKKLYPTLQEAGSSELQIVVASVVLMAVAYVLLYLLLFLRNP